MKLIYYISRNIYAISIATLLLFGWINTSSAVVITNGPGFVQFSESVFGGPLQAFVLNNSSGPVSVTQQSSGGPGSGSFGRLDMTVSDGTTLWGGMLLSNMVYVPNGTNAISSLDYTFRVGRLANRGGSFQLLALQDGVFYSDGVNNMINFGGPDQTFSWNSLNPGSFFSWPDNLSGSSLDFAADASPITFGVAFGNTNGSGSSQAVAYGVDDFSVTVNLGAPVPVPAALPLFGSGLAMLFGLARWRAGARGRPRSGAGRT